jgi:HSP20 family molecular chaperone IbpA
MADLAKKTDDVRVFTPYVDMAETKDGFVIWADVPGATKDGINIKLDSDVLSVSVGVSDTGPEGMPLLYREHYAGNYEVSFRISDGIKRDKISAELKDGVLKVVLPKAEKASPRQIKVKAA